MSHAVGFRVKSGWASAVLLAGPAHAPRALDRRAIELSDPDLPETRQPYHAAMGRLEEDRGRVQKRTKIIHAVTRRSVAALLEDYRAAGYSVLGAGLVVGSRVEPASIANPHIRAHALEGQLFRTTLEEALQANGLGAFVVVEREAYAEAAARLARPADDLKKAVSSLGRALSGPWRADEKLAALAAWMALVRADGSGVTGGGRSGSRRAGAERSRREADS